MKSPAAAAAEYHEKADCMTTILFGCLIFTLAVVLLAIGVIIKGKPLRGSCGGPKPVGPDGEPLTCDHCTCSQQEPSQSQLLQITIPTNLQRQE
jgi:hypothetical protein